MRDPIQSMVSRRRVLAAAGGAALTAAAPGAAARTAAPPNILFILADDLGYADLSCYGRRDYRTPVLDALAAGGLLMTQGYANSAVCSPTRVALMTGRYHQRLPVGLPEPIRGRDLDPVALPLGHATLPGLLKRAGYRTALVGKWHLGWPPEHGPLRYGYDRFFGTPAGASDYFNYRDMEAPDGLYEGDAITRGQGYLTDRLADRAVHELRRAAAERLPLFLSLHFTAPHWPWQGPDDAASSARIGSLRHEDGGSLETYAKMVGAMDAAIGRVLAEVDRLGQAADTIVVFTSDNGGERYSDTWPLRGGKGELLEGGIRVPLVMRWPRRIAPGGRSRQVMATMDWLPTLAAAAGAELHPDFPPDGANLLDVLTGGQAPIERTLFWRFRNKQQAAVRDADWKYLRIGDDEGLFDVAADPRERANLKSQQAAVFARLKEAFVRWNATMLAYPPEQDVRAPA